MTETSGSYQGRREARILIVDDEPLNVDYLEQELEELGFATETASSGAEALERVAADPPDLVLLDVMMPEMDGITALRMLKRDPETRLIPVVLMTALNAVEDRVSGIEAGADDFLSKPVDERELLARIRTALTQKRAIDETLDELERASAHLERYAPTERDVAVLAVAWRSQDESVPEEAVQFVARTHKEMASERIRALGGTLTHSKADISVAVFEGSDPIDRSMPAISAALAIVSGDSSTPSEREASSVSARAAISIGTAQVGSTRVLAEGETRWVFAAEGQPVDRAVEIARAGPSAGVLVTSDLAAALGGRVVAERQADDTYVVVRSIRDPAASEVATPRLNRQVRSILVINMVGSTSRIERVGDRAWSELVAAHDDAIRQALRLFGGTEIDTAGDGFLATFDVPALAIRCAVAAVDRVAPLGMTIRAGIHTGEVELREGRVRGIAVHLANRIAASARGGEILVSGTTRELAAGGGLAFDDRGEHTLRGVSEPRRLYAVATDDSTDSAVAAERPGIGAITPFSLTAREVEVLGLVAIGLSDAEVSERLYLSVRTVNAHLRSVYRKLGVRSRSAAIRLAQERGLL
jgi:DNA-binding NarL/FixJ family response regulator